MTDDEALELVQHLKAAGIELRQRGRLLYVERGAPDFGEGLRLVIGKNWHAVARAVSVRRQADKLIATAARKPVRDGVAA